MPNESQQVVIITGAAGDIGSALAEELADEYAVVGLDLPGTDAECALIPIDITSDHSVELAMRKFHEQYGSRIASVIHLAAYFDFTGEDHPLYTEVNVEGTRRLMRALQSFQVEQFIYSGTMLVHAPVKPGERINESTPIQPRWAYPTSKAKAEEAVRAECGKVPCVFFHLAGLYDDKSAVPTLSHQIARIYERDLKSRVYSGDQRAGQSLVHKDDVINLFRRAIDRRRDLPPEATFVAGEPDAAGYCVLQDRIAELVHGTAEWRTLNIPTTLAKAGAWVEEKGEPIVPDDFDQGEKPFIRPFMVEMADDHYALDISKARKLLDWSPKNRVLDTLPKLIDALKSDPVGWYRRNGITPPRWLSAADDKTRKPDALRARHESRFRSEHQRYLWAHWFNLAIGTWLITSPPLLGYRSEPLIWSDVAAGVAVLLFASLSLSWRFGWARWSAAAVGVWVLAAPVLFWAPTAAAYLNGTICGAMIIGFAVLTPPTPGIDPAAASAGPSVPPGWNINPSSWLQRLPIIILALVGLYVSRNLAAYQLGHIDGVWEPFFAATADAGKNGTEQIITSAVSKAWPVSDAGVGALTYMLEILTGVVGSVRRWRTMPWLVVLFGIMIVPLGVVSITFIIIQPIVIGTWCTLCLIAALAMLLQIPYSLDELAATGEFLWRKHKAGEPVLRIFFVGGSDSGGWQKAEDEFTNSPYTVTKEIVSGGVGLPWNLVLCIGVGVWLMFTRLTLGAEAGMANSDHLIGALAVTISVAALAEVARPVRFLNIPLGIALLVTPFVYDAGGLATLSSLLCGGILILLCLPRGPVRNKYGSFSKLIV